MAECGFCEMEVVLIRGRHYMRNADDLIESFPCLSNPSPQPTPATHNPETSVPRKDSANE